MKCIWLASSWSWLLKSHWEKVTIANLWLSASWDCSCNTWQGPPCRSSWPQASQSSVKSAQVLSRQLSYSTSRTRLNWCSLNPTQLMTLSWSVSCAPSRRRRQTSAPRLPGMRKASFKCSFITCPFGFHVQTIQVFTRSFEVRRCALA